MAKEKKGTDVPRKFHKYKTEYAQMLYNHLCEGNSFKSFTDLVDITEKALHGWKKRYRDFGDAYTNAKRDSGDNWNSKVCVGMKSKYKTDYAQMMHNHLKEGFSFKSFARRINTTAKTLHQWRHDHPDFSDAYDLARTATEGWWDDLGRTHALSNANAWKANVEMRFGHSAYRPSEPPEDDEREGELSEPTEQVREPHFVSSGADRDMEEQS